MKTKICRNCNKPLPLVYFTSTQARYCNPCRVTVKLKQRNAMIQRSLDKARNKKPKTKQIIRVSDLKKEVQKVFNKYIKLRDRGNMCISCQKNPIEHAGHFIAQGATGALRYHENNVWGQCSNCNVWKRGNLLEYRISLVNKIGEERVKWLEEHRHDIKKWTREELEELMTTYKAKLKELENL